ncbi:hypothetical protein EHO60_11560 [Leptospira fletcheri]|uniref:Lipoprotein n=1 Tax=Leptospira fletcheri TaxID=2484981 RepID=A0A4R9GEA8_9LEPT|nr:hypothetical protein [Leptospira fletcheri]TGK10101.1 hypothetical protein EHO60_11560 [Leptospira fletcheri]
MGRISGISYSFYTGNLKTRRIGSTLFSLLFLFLSNGCGTNTEVAQSPFVFLTPVTVPQVYSVLATNPGMDNYFNVIDPLYSINYANYKPNYLLKYFVTNLEPQFVGYNLYITAATPSIAETSTSGGLYLVNGTQPSFPQLAIQDSTTTPIIQRVQNFIPPPGVTSFQKCEVYTFTLRALLNSGVLSNQSTPVSRCSSLQPALECGTDTSCNPSYCQDPACTASVQATCSVGTICNPCNYPSVAKIGCPCPSGVLPPGCNL